MTNWDRQRDLTLDFSFLGNGDYQAIVFKDGINADRDGTDYKKELIKISGGYQIDIHLAPGEGWAARIEKLKMRRTTKPMKNKVIKALLILGVFIYSSIFRSQFNICPECND